MALKLIEQNITGTVCIFFFHIDFETWCGFFTCSIFQFSSKFGFSVSMVTFKMPAATCDQRPLYWPTRRSRVLVRGASMKPPLIQKCIADSVVSGVKDDVIQFKWFLDTLTDWGGDAFLARLWASPWRLVSDFILPGGESVLRTQAYWMPRPTPWERVEKKNWGWLWTQGICH